MEKRFVDQLPATPVQWLSDNGLAYAAEQMVLFAEQIGLQPMITPACSLHSDGMAESFVNGISLHQPDIPVLLGVWTVPGLLLGIVLVRR